MFLKRYNVQKLLSVWNPFVEKNPWSDTDILTKEQIKHNIEKGLLRNLNYGANTLEEHAQRIAWICVNNYEKPLKVNIDYLSKKFLFFEKEIHLFCAKVYLGHTFIDGYDEGSRDGFDKFYC